MSKKQNLKKTLKGPDPLQKAVVKGGSYFKQNEKLLTILAVVFLLGAVIYAGADYYQTSTLENRRLALAEIDRIFEAEVKAVEERRGELNKELAGLRSEKTALEQKDKKSPELAELDKKIDALETQAKDLKPDHTKSMERYKSFYGENKNNPQGWASGMRVVGNVLEKEQLAEAQEILNGILSRSRHSTFYQVLAGFSLIGVLEDQSKYDEALEVVADLERRVPEKLQSKLLVHKGRLLIAKNEGAAAKETLDKLIKEHGDAPEADKARSMKALLN